jgi:streptogramin lyase
MFRRCAMVLGVASLVFVVGSVQAGTFLVASDYFGPMRKVNPDNGAIIGTLSGGYDAGEIDRGPDGLIYASYFESSLIQAIDPNSGSTVRGISLPGKPRDVTFGPDGKLYIALTGDGFGHGNIGIYQYDLGSGQLNKFSTSTLNGSPIGIAFGPGNDLFVCLDARYGGNGSHSVVRIDGQTGVSEGVFASAGVSIPQSLAFGPDGDLYVGNQGTGCVTRYASDGTYLGILTSAAGNPQGLYFLPDGDLVLGRGGSDFARYDFSSNTLSTFSTGYSFASGVVLVPEPSTLVLLGIGAISLLAYAWRRRR